MAIPAYMWLKDDQGNDVKGSVTVAEREGSIEILHFDHELRIPTDNDTGELTGTRKHEPFVITKAVDAATPYMYKACSNGQTLKQLELKWYRIDDTGTEREYFRHTLEDVKITSITPTMHNVKDLDKERYPHLETVHMRYKRITWTYLDGNIEFSDSWTEGR
ncbi:MULTISPECIES: Hcp family type VI secretion system effector [Pseudoalteromonas]|jgi:type VI secretion system secreted protein Hcp|uniref:Hcp family type VI secretion system effector n=2 Tax=Pseudoalteromonas TaxID=53246 RepID=A0A0F4P690_PSEO7|nr:MULTISPECIES: Hcp family type VI secretion system effector [Pseudoalteromonas]ASD66984.1 Hcp1 family type VI secretion system effector [Pseudoalteromonas piscicida]ATD06381.1 type VI secretion system secreted protein Hcp [Pseudoalteromonas piscicida]AUJ70086.1 Major exported protein [Pseudoalteromonas sp. NC201]AXQ97909.1 Hcp family type VI secretion system effector [Pseudoalteromonas piscicida]AXR02307.1 Hcp family type VI secretion system effector [Pseudoalteromonas piscicida]